MNRFDERKKDFNSAYQRLEEALQVEQNDVVIDGVLYRFEFTFELAWKTIKDYLEYMGISEGTGSPRENIKMAFQQQIISDGELWIENMLDRNSLTHLYDEEKSREIYEKIKNKYIYAFKDLNDKIQSL